MKSPEFGTKAGQLPAPPYEKPSFSKKLGFLYLTPKPLSFTIDVPGIYYVSF